MNLLQNILNLAAHHDGQQKVTQPRQEHDSYNPYDASAIMHPGQQLQVQRQQQPLNGAALREPSAPVVYPSINNMYGTDPVGGSLQAGYDNQPIQPTYAPANSQLMQGGRYNQGMIPLQGSRGVRPIQARNSNWLEF